MKTMVTVTQVGDAIRLSRVTAHGEEIILDPDIEMKSLAILLWGKLGEANPQGGNPLLPWHAVEGKLDRLTQAIEKLAQIVEKHDHSMREFQVKINTATKPTPVNRGQ